MVQNTDIPLSLSLASTEFLIMFLCSLADDEEEDDVHLVPSSADDAPRTSKLVSVSATENSSLYRPSGHVVGIIKRNWHSYVISRPS